jgi:hypothetical protein
MTDLADVSKRLLVGRVRYHALLAGAPGERGGRLGGHKSKRTPEKLGTRILFMLMEDRPPGTDLHMDQIFGVNRKCNLFQA